jgi:DNA replication protein DnaC
MENSVKRIQLKCFENYKVNEFNKDAFNKAKAFLNNDRGLFISGTVGSGKTHLATATYNIVKSKSNAKFISVPELLLDIRETFGSRGSERDIVDKYTCDTEYLFLDDFGAENSSDFSIEVLYLILSRWEKKLENPRCDFKSKLFITSNFDLNKLADVMSDRLASRITGICVGAVINEKIDWRLKTREEK